MTDTSLTLGRITSQEIASQPDCWTRAHEQGAGRTAGLPAAGERVLVLGCGTSYYVAGAYAWLREQSGLGVTDAQIASELPPVLRDYDRVVAISRSGTTTEVVQALEVLPAGTPVTAVLGELGTPVGALATDIVDLSYADERSVVQTRFPTTLLTLLRTHLGATGPDVAGLVEQARSALAEPTTTPVPRQLVVLGTGWAAALAQEAALKCRESVGMWAEAYATGEYRHGPISVAGPGTLVWALTPLTPVQAEAIEATGATVREASRDPQAELIAVQRHAVAWAAAGGRDADVPAHLTRSVVVL
ncbi:SIS domain-containing protein [Paractinoplanes globisporus]|uniref:SIS domain-containing protein n=1 Tax=Paractinoplanes globisporus TaxID=113565 RepID=A0ABW6W5B7_9ACTN|nr:SIS domain-containing protein [Actinoplanes globisporus]